VDPDAVDTFGVAPQTRKRTIGTRRDRSPTTSIAGSMRSSIRGSIRSSFRERPPISSARGGRGGAHFERGGAHFERGFENKRFRQGPLPTSVLDANNFEPHKTPLPRGEKYVAPHLLKEGYKLEELLAAKSEWTLSPMDLALGMANAMGELKPVSSVGEA